MIDQHKQAFIEEAAEIMSELEQTLLSLEKDNANKELVSKAFRALHTIKGSGGMFGYEDLAVFVHDIESAFEKIRNGEMEFNKNIADLTLAACDQMNAMIFTDKGKKVNDKEVKRIIEAFRKLISSETILDDLVETKPLVESTTLKLFFIHFGPQEDIYHTGTDPVLIINDIADLGEVVLAGKVLNELDLDNINPELLYIHWDLILRTTRTIDAIKDVFIFVEDLAQISVKELKIDEAQVKKINLKDLNNLLFVKDKIKEDDLTPFYQEDAVKAEEKQVEKTEKVSSDSKSIRVSSEKLDELVNLVGELVTVQAGLSQLIYGVNDQRLISFSEQIERLTSHLRDSTLNIRMLPIGSTFSKFNRLVRDLSKELGKEVELTTDGAETELDKSIIERLNDPLVHILRNSIDHGIESPVEREKKGKLRKGMLHLSAKQAGGNVIIQISDDGAGINFNAVKEKAVKLGLINSEQELSKQEISNLIFKAGFSTSSKITNISGRGVGMDVVRQSIDALRGAVELESEQDEGTTISIKLPLTLAIIDGLLVEVGTEFFVIPLFSVEECVEITTEEENKRGNRHILKIRDEIVPYLKLREQFNVKSEAPQIQQVVIVNVDGFRIGFVVDEVKGQHQTVLKTLGSIFKDVEGVSGATILGDGNIALILDIQKLAQLQELSEKEYYEKR